ncbi:MAG: zinc ribbon domain-containing protein [Candidatus Eremiobacteraeota bacterium]|nr:zinc ribbon domain-containing protein [Candidatus Eremiobacteraeota bacterium]MCW5869115.1 zinc ribbon domain-containing protein [Candidatus Eremiobacteraeota bacterium]
MDDEFANLVPDEDEEIPEDAEDLEESTAEVPLEVLARCREYTDVEPFEELKKEAEAYLRGEVGAESVREKWQSLDQELGARHHYFQDGLRFQEWSEQLVVTGRQIFEQFEWIQDQMGRLEVGLAAGLELEVAYALEQIHGSLAVLKSSYQTLRDLQDSLPTLSENPMVAELIRVGQLALEQKIPMESFLERLAVYADMQDRLQQALLTAQPAPRERSILEAERANLDEAFAHQQRGLDELYGFAENPDAAELEKGIASLELGSQMQLRLRERLLQTVGAEDTRACPFCGSDNQSQNRFCASCQARLPENLAVQAEEISLGSPQDNGLPSHFQRLVSAVEQRQAEQLDDPAWQSTLSWFRGLYINVCRQRDRQKPPPANIPPEQLELLEKAGESLNTGLELIGEGLGLLEDGEELQNGLDLILRGGEKLQEMPAWLDEATNLTNALQESQA